MRNLKIRTKLIVSFSVVILMTLSLGVLASITSNLVGRYYRAIIDQPLERRQVATELKFEFAQVRINAFQMLINSDFDIIQMRLDEMLGRYPRLEYLIERYEQTVINDSSISNQDRERLLSSIREAWDIMIEYRRIYNELYNTILSTRDLSLNVIDPVAAASTGDINNILFALYDEAVIQVENEYESTISFGIWSVVWIAVTAFLLVIVSLVMAIYIISNIARSISRMKEGSRKVAKGDLSVNMRTNSRDELGELSNYIADMLGQFNNLVDEVNEITSLALAGGLSMRLKEDSFVGDYKDVAVGLNQTIGVLAQDSLDLAEITREYAEGNFEAKLHEFHGESAMFNEAADGVQANLKAVYSEIRAMINAIQNGNLDYRINSNVHKGDWARLTEGLNSVIVAFSEPFEELNNSLSSLSIGEFKKMEGSYQGDFKNIKDTANRTIDNMSSYVLEISEVLVEMSNKNFNQSITREYVGEFSKIKDSLTSIVDSLSNVISEIGSAAEQVNVGAKQISAGAMNLATGASEQASSLEEINSTIDIITETATENLEKINNVDQFASGSRERANRSNDDMKKLLDAMNGIKDFSIKIGNIIKVIEDIAFQTNLLALNASVEAARAGEHGRGFAVVAEEVRALASRSQNAAKETKDLIEESIRSVESGTEMADQTAGSLERIVSDSVEIATLIEAIAEAVAHENEILGQIALGVAQVTSVVTSNSATSEEAASSSEELSSQADVMKNLVSQFNTK